ncbi:MAG: glutamate-1-semialdehyde 2,1-aminomutase [bacterium]
MALMKNLFKKAVAVIPGGVNSPVRSFKSVGSTPLFINEGKGSIITSEEGKRYIDYCLSWGALILGHAYHEVVEQVQRTLAKGTSFGTATKNEVQLAELITSIVPSIDQVRLTNSGTEAVMAAIRLSRAYTRRDLVIKFEGAYHGHADYLLSKAGSGLLSIPSSAGVPADFVKHTITLPYNDLNKLEHRLKKIGHKTAAIIVEPVMANIGIVKPHKDFLKTLRALTKKYGILLIFDEVITGFRLSLGGAQEYFGIYADLVCFGKIIGGGMSVGAFGGKRKIMKLLAPEGSVYQAGTLSGNPVATSAGIITLGYLQKNKPYTLLELKTRKLYNAFLSLAHKNKIRMTVNMVASMFSISFEGDSVRLFKIFFNHLLHQGIYIAPSSFETNFLSIAHSEHDLDHTINAVRKVLLTMGENI